MRNEPVAVLAAIGTIVTTLCHDYFPELDPKIVSALGVLITAIARQFVSPHKKEEPKVVQEPPKIDLSFK